MCKVSYCKILHVIDEITKKNNEKKKTKQKQLVLNEIQNKLCL